MPLFYEPKKIKHACSRQRLLGVLHCAGRTRPHAKAFAEEPWVPRLHFPPIVLRDNLRYRDLVAEGVVTSWMGVPYPLFQRVHGEGGLLPLARQRAACVFGLWQKAALVLEDDNRIPADPAQTRARLEAFLQVPYWKFLNLSPCFCDCLFSRELATAPGIHQATGQCTSAYLVRPEGARAFLDRMFPLRPVVQIALDTVIPRLPDAYEARPRLFEQNDATASTNGNNFASRLCFVTWNEVGIGIVVVLLIVAIVVGVMRQAGRKTLQ